MNRSAQPEVHPDADSLNAFVEQALPGAEREQIVAHLSACGRCREVVFLAQEAAAQELQPEPAPVLAVPRPSWWSRWGTAWGKVWIPAAACAALAGSVVVWIQLRPAPAAVNMAQSVPMEAMPAPSGPATAKLAAPPPPPHPSAQRPSIKASAPSRPRRTPAEVALALSQSTETENGSLARARAGTAMAQRAPGSNVPMPTTSPSLLSGLAATTWQPQAPGLAQGAPSSVPGAQPMPAAPSRIHGAAMAKASPWQTVAAAPAPPLAFTAQPLNGVMALRTTRHTLLPSGLRTVSTAAVLDRLLAIDSAGALYLSHDAGKHWETVNAQWSGKAVEVIAEPEATVPSDTMGDSKAPPDAAQDETRRMESPASTGSVPAAGSIAAKPDTPPAEEKTAAPVVLFKLVNDRHQTWVSADGKVWREP